MKQSKYNFIFKQKDGRVALYNALRNGAALVRPELVEAVYDYCQGERDLDPSTLENLTRGGFLVGDEEDEFAALLIRRRKNQFDGQTLSITLAPTLECNLGCSYCYEQPGRGVMSEQTQAQVIEFIGRHFDAGVKSLVLSWYGGEPLLCLGIIESMSQRIIAMCEERNVSYRADIVTNGTGLNEAAVRILKEAKVEAIQITIDGDRTTHDQRRPFKEGSGSSFDAILANLPHVLQEMADVSIRINVDKTNLAAGAAIASALHAEPWAKGTGLYTYFGFVRNLTSSCKCNDKDLMSVAEFHRADMEALRALRLEQGIKPYPEVRPGGCIATKLLGFVIGPEGELYKCWNNVGNSNAVIGHVSSPMVFNQLHAEYLMEGFETDPACMACNYLPLCMGGCVDIRVSRKRNPAIARDCVSWKWQLEQAIKDRAEAMI